MMTAPAALRHAETLSTAPKSTRKRSTNAMPPPSNRGVIVPQCRVRFYLNLALKEIRRYERGQDPACIWRAHDCWKDALAEARTDGDYRIVLRAYGRIMDRLEALS